VLLVGVVAVLLLAGRQLAAGLPTLVTWIEAHPRWAVLGYVGSYVVATVAWVPGSILTLAAGALFGLVEGTLYTLIGATAGGTLAFLVARHVAREGVRARLGGGARVEAVDEAVAREGWKVVFLIRLSPLLPFNALNYLFGLTRVRLVDYVTASVLGMAPGTFLYVYAGYTAGKVATAATGAEPAGAGRWALLGLGLVATGVATWLVTRTARRALAETDVTGSGEGTG
jgi:uncharacterized membrane protein YdjX (TVP38/TMEM64 family)